MVQCPKCGGETHAGEAFARVSVGGGQVPTGFGMISMPGMGMPGLGYGAGETMTEQKIQWREKTGGKTGWLIKSDEERIMTISGLRCEKCGHIELYARE
ncbi:MAG: hypothetical protein V1857_06525 [archaeon]